MFNWLTFKVLAWIAAALGVVIIGLGVALWAQGVRVGKAQNARDKAQNALVEANKTIKGQVALLTECDTATKKLEAEGKERQKAADKAVADARTEAGRYQQEVKRLRGLQGAPSPSGADCRQAVREIRK